MSCENSTGPGCSEDSNGFAVYIGAVFLFGSWFVCFIVMCGGPLIEIKNLFCPKSVAEVEENSPQEQVLQDQPQDVPNNVFVADDDIPVALSLSDGKMENVEPPVAVKHRCYGGHLHRQRKSLRNGIGKSRGRVDMKEDTVKSGLQPEKRMVAGNGWLD